MRKIGSVLLMGALVLSLAGCNSQKAETAQTAAETTKAADDAAETK